jgi:AAA15 family ATPase/GTPase
VSFEQLSAGYKGVITIICDLISRLSEKQQVESIADFQGVVLIDEVELHLHPKWKYNFMKKLRDTFPEIQFIVTTHSPTVILGASKEAVFYKIYKEEGEVKISNQIANEGYTHNSLVSSPLFDLDTITSREYDKKRVSSDDYIYDKIHQVISLRIKEDINTSEEDIMKLVNEELDKL